MAYSAGPEWPDPKTITNWPGTATYETRNKVDTAVFYNTNTGVLHSWGFECEEDEHDTAFEVNRLFKLFLDSKYNDQSGYAPTHGDVQRWYQDYLTCLYNYVASYCQERIPRFTSKNVEWLFSVPTVWR